MASPNTLIRNALLADLRPSRIPVEIEQAPKTAAPGEFATMLREYGRIKNVERATERHARSRGRAIPTSGPGRRRAKAIRNRNAVLGYVDVTASVTGPRTIVRGRQYEGAGLLTEVLDWCYAHPFEGPLPESGELNMYRRDGAVVIEGDAPDVFAITGDLLDMAGSEYVTFAAGVLTMTVEPEPLHYRPLGPHPSSRVVVFERVRGLQDVAA